MEFRSGQDAPLKPVEIVAVEEAPLDSYVSFCVDGGKDTLSSWSLSIKDSAGVTQKFGPYVLERIFLSGKSILGTRAQGDYTVTMTGQTTTGLEVIKDTTVHMVLWVPSEKEEGMRFSVIYEFNSSDAIKIYEKYLSEVVVPKIPIDSKVYIAGYTDVGIESHNLKLSMARANDVKDIMKTALSKAGRTDVTFKVDGYGEDTNHSPFENGLPEERFYNRTVVIEVVPKN
jgi:outer membrane protein OmpA-like peptidoglycan-associated protein